MPISFISANLQPSENLTSLAETGAYQLASDGSEIVYAASNQAVYRSTDGGRTWQKADGNGLMTHNDVQRVILKLTDAGTLIMTAQLFTLDAGGWVGRSVDGGDNWEVSYYGSPAAAEVMASAGGSTIFLGVVSTQFTGSGGLYRSDDDGRTWERIREDEVYGLYVDESEGMYVGTDDGLFFTADGGVSLEPLGLDGQIVGSIFAASESNVLESTVHKCYDALDPPILCEGVSALYRITSGRDERQVGLTPARVQALAVDAQGRLLAGTRHGVLPRSGDAWGAALWSYGGVEEFAVTSAGDVLLATNEAGLWRIGDEWPLPLNTCDNFTCAVPAVLHLDSGETLASIKRGFYGGPDDGVFRSSGSLEAWDVVLEDAEIHAFAEGAGDTVYAGGSGVFFRSVDGGLSWVDETGSLPAGAVIGDLAISNGEVLAATSDGLYSRRLDSDWGEAGLSGTPVHAVERAGNGGFYAATDDGVYEGAAGEWQLLAGWYDWPAAYALLVESDGTVYVGTEEGVVTFREDDPELQADTLDWHGYFPLEVGNVWQYEVEVTESFGTIGSWIEQWEIASDTMIGDRDYFRLDVTCDSVEVWEGLFTEPCGPDVTESHYVRYDESAANVETYGDSGRPWRGRYDFRLDAPFYYDDAPDIGFAYRPLDRVQIGANVIESGLKGIYVYDAVPGGFTFAHGIGLVGQGFDEGGGILERLRYVRTSSVELGRFFNVGTETPPTSHDELALEAYPNPASDAFVLELKGVGTGTVTVELFDVLGRQVRTLASEFVHSGTWRAHRSAAALGAGVYYMVATVDGRVAARRELVVVR